MVIQGHNDLSLHQNLCLIWKIYKCKVDDITGEFD